MPELEEARRLALEFATIVVVEHPDGPHHTRNRAMMLAALEHIRSLAFLATTTLACSALLLQLLLQYFEFLLCDVGAVKSWFGAV